MAARNYQRWVSIGYVGMAAVTYLLVGQLAELVWDLARWSFPEGWPLTPPELFGFAAGGVLFVICRRSDTINGFMNESAVELSKVTWPHKKESLLSAGVVSIVVGISAAFLTMFDVVWGWAVKLVF